MADTAILVDFGASRVKAVLWSFQQACVLARVECSAPKLVRGVHGEAEGAPEDYWQALVFTVGRLTDLEPVVCDVWICSEMHGFILADIDSRKPITPYISWQDQRAFATPTKTSRNKLDELTEIFGEDFQRETGHKLRAGLPIVNLSCMLKSVNLHRKARFLTLTDWLLLRGGENAPRCHPTMAAGTGFYSLVSGGWSEEICTRVGIPTDSLVPPSLSISETDPIGSITLGTRSLRVWGGLGDMQAAALGAGFPEKAPVFVNLGTGSQVMAVSRTVSREIERRLYVGKLIANAITHIPAGRALNAYASFFDECSRLGGGGPHFWSGFQTLSADDVLATPPTVDLNIFPSSWRFNGGGSITAVTDKNLTPGWLLRSIAISWLTQYAQAVEAIPNQLPESTFLVGGGLLRRAAFIPVVLEKLLSRRIVSIPLRTGEESLEGLLYLAETSV